MGSRPLYKDASLHIKPKDRIGLIGANGTGKSTLLRLIIGEYVADEGNISRSGDTTIGFLNQDLLSYQSNESILSVAMQAFERQLFLQKEIDKVLAEMEADYQDHQVERLTKLQEEFEILDGYRIESKASEILEGLGFKTQDLHKPLAQFSGGWRMRVMLAKLLLQQPSLLMLDEPTNHLDLPSIEWVESYLNSYEGATIVVSHDRYFLDRVSNTIVEISQQKLNLYSGNYSFYLEEKAMRQEIQQNSYENQQQKIRQTERFIERFKAKASKSRQVQSRVKSLERLDLVDEVIDENIKVHFRFIQDRPSGKIVTELEDVSKAYGDLKILENTTAQIIKGDKIALIGANGKGKSTLLRIIAGTENIEGESKLGYNVSLSFFAQHQLESLNIENTILEELKQAGSEKNEVELRTILGCFLFTGEDVFKKIKVLSGGEKSRVALAKTLVSKANFLLLDEPTNHLDMQSVSILIQALQQYEGTYLTISHDRHFINQVANKIWYIEDHQIKEYLGTYQEYVYWQEEIRQEQLQAPKTETKKPKAEKPVVQKNDTQNDKRKLQKEVDELEKRISDLEKEKNRLEDLLSKDEVFSNPYHLGEHTQSLNKVNKEIQVLTQKWENLMMELE